MFSKFTSMIHNAVEAVSFTPNLPQQQSFIGHWKSVTRYFIENKEHKVAIEQTQIPSHMEEMLRILQEEETRLESGSTGPCMEYLLQHKILETLYTLARTDCPPGMKQQVLVFFTSLLSKIHQPLLPHVNVHKAVHRLVRVCGEVKAGPSENEEIQFLCTVCAKLKMDPYLVNFFIEMSKPCSTTGDGSVNAATAKPTFNIVNSLLCLLHSADARVAVKACEGLMLCVSLPEQNSAKCIVENTELSTELTRMLCDLYEKLPKAMDPADIECVEANWGLDIMSDTEDRHNFVGKRALLSFLSWFDYCDQLVSIAEPSIAMALAETINQQFLQAKLEPAILQQSEAGATTATAHLCRCLRLVSSPRLLTVFVRFILGDDRSPEPATVVGSRHKVRQRLLERCDHLSDEMSITSLKLFETLLLKPDEHVIHNLVLRNLLGRAYYLDGDNEQTRNNVRNTSGDISDSPVNEETEGSGGTEQTASPAHRDEGLEDNEQRSEFSDDGCLDDITPPSSPRGSPSVHTVVNSFLSLVPDDAKSSCQTADSEYDTYLRDARRQFSEVCAQCVEWNWPTEALSNPDYTTESFYEGSFLSMFFDKITRMLDQSYDVNLQVTSVVSRLVMLPHPNLHEYLLNPMLPTKPGLRTLSSVIKKVVHDVETRMKQTEDFPKQLASVRQQLMGMADNIRRSPPNILKAKARDQSICIDDGHMLEGVIVLEEFCKELAAIACVKYYAAATI